MPGISPRVMCRLVAVLVVSSLTPSFALPITALAATAPASPAVAYGLASDPNAVPRFEPTKCAFSLTTGQKEGENVNCGYVVVPQKHSDPTGPTLRLAVARFRSTSDTPAPEPIVYLEGGPGDPGIGRSTATFAARYTDDRDFVIFDQRGVGQSEPALTCPETTRQNREDYQMRESYSDEAAHYRDALIACRERLASKYDLTAFTTAENAADVNDIRVALGYDAVALLGASYGSRLALTVMRDTPGIVHSAVIDAVVPPDVDSYGDSVTSYDRALRLLFDACAEDTACNSAFPDLPADFSHAVARLDADPLTIPLSSTDGSSANGQAVSFVLTGERLVEYLHNYLYSASIMRDIPILIEQLKDGNASLFRDLITLSSGGATSSSGMRYSVICHDALPFSDRNAATTANDLLPEVRDIFPAQQVLYDVCAHWGAQTPDPIEHQPVTSDIPTLVLASVNDPITPPMYAQDALLYLSHGVYVEGPGLGHSLSFNSVRCGASIALDFFASPDHAPDTQCLDAWIPRFLTEIKRYPKPPPMTIDPAKRYTATIETTKGPVTLDLLADVAPIAVNNFVFLARDHFFDGLDFFNITPGSGVGSGDPVNLGQDGPGYTIKRESPPPGLDYERGTVIMGNSGANASGSQFFIVSADLHGKITGKNTIFANVTDGMEVVDQILAWQTSDMRERRPIVLSLSVQEA